MILPTANNKLNDFSAPILLGIFPLPKTNKTENKIEFINSNINAELSNYFFSD